MSFGFPDSTPNMSRQCLHILQSGLSLLLSLWILGAQALFIHNAILPCLFNSLQGNSAFTLTLYKTQCPVLQEVVLDQPALLNPFALQRTSQWDPAKQVPEEVKICSSKFKSVILLLALGTLFRVSNSRLMIISADAALNHTQTALPCWWR